MQDTRENARIDCSHGSGGDPPTPPSPRARKGRVPNTQTAAFLSSQQVKLGSAILLSYKGALGNAGP